MLLEQGFLDALVAGRVDLAFRRWAAPRVKKGTQMRTSHGVVEVLAIDAVERADVTHAEAKRAGEASREDLLKRLDARDGTIYRVRLRYAGADPRVELRSKDDLDADELAAIRARLERFDRHGANGPWTATVLRLIGARPGVRAAILAERLGRDLPAFKRDVRKLKELGLTESLEIGYRLSPRGQAVLAALGG